ncbi:hypothetical protein VOLCADRAFT_97713 [Volvox carteri f. nagariensis]|uniref:PHD-type domain-containing protein n=1 Tax=Volvox carteri f. nagariensis TaxID=3068 RepID=D8UDG3_VOLCA|nr:uncharacterized protein VOLCADRAFT_97713 [Volvox carteri f. nagariensis]EFJ42307.1 hypothetical protein VOLCADRAFT_97713 [Volvox carteri f. nagariensis]|eukprot:XP_002956705.1 hypothetical protein VOLCADRAFT_97713 [Volvox carteri f. nagariensis]
MTSLPVLLRQQLLRRWAPRPCQCPAPRLERHLTAVLDLSSDHQASRNWWFGHILQLDEYRRLHRLKWKSSVHLAFVPSARPSTATVHATQAQSQHHQAPAITPTEFERHSGLLTAKKWRNSIRLLQGDGTITIGKWLEQHNILPRPKCSGPLGSPGPGGSGSMAVIYGFGADGIGHPGGLSSGTNDNSHAHGTRGGGGGGFEHHVVHPQLGRCTLPPSRYPASEYVTGEDEEYDEVGAQLAGGSGAGADEDGLVAGEDMYGALDDGGDPEDGLYSGPSEAAGSRGGRRPAAHRGARSGAGGLRASDRRRVQGRPAGTGAGSRASSGRHGPRGRLAGPQQRGTATLAGIQQQQQQFLQGRGVVLAGMADSSPGVGSGAVRRGSGSGAGRGASSLDDGGEEDEGGNGGNGAGKGHSSSEGSPPSDDSKRRGGGSGGSGEGDGSGTGDGGDSCRPGTAGMDGERRAADEAPGCTRRSMRHGLGTAKAQLQHLHLHHHHHHQQQQQQQHREGAADPGGVAQDRSTRHAAAVKRLPPEYLTGSEIGPLLKRSRTRPSGAASVAGPGGGGGEGWSPAADELAALYDIAAAVPQVRGWRFLGSSADPISDQVLISVSINGRTYTGLLAPQQSVPAPPPPPPPLATAAAAAATTARLRAPLAAHAGSPGTGAGGGGSIAAAAALSGRRPGSAGGGGAGSGVHGRALTTSTGRTSLPPPGPSSRLCLLAAAGLASGSGQEDYEAVAGTGGEFTDPPAGAAHATGAAAGAGTAPLEVEDAPQDDGMPPDCPRCALCHRWASPLLAPPPPTPGYALPSPVQAKAVPGILTVVQVDQGGPEVATQREAGLVRTGVSAPPPPPSEAAAAAYASDPGTVCGGGGGTAKATASGMSTAQPEEATGTAGTSSGGSMAGDPTEAADVVATNCNKLQLCVSSSGVVQAEAPAPSEMPAAPAAGGAPQPPAAAAAAPKVEVKSEGDSADIVVLPPGLAASCATQQQQQQQQQQAAVAGCGLGPLVEVRAGPAAGHSGHLTVLVHSQCALWSAEVFVIGGAMYGVPAVIKRSRGQRCAHCGRSGATLSCCSARCGRTYHLPCAMEAGATLVAEPYSMACPLHRGGAPTAAHTTSSTGPQGRMPQSRLRPAPSQDASQSTATTTATTTAAVTAATATGGAAHLPLTQSQGQQQQQVPLPRSLQIAAGRRIVLPPLSAAAPPPPPQPPGNSAAGEPPPPLPPPAQRTSRVAADASSLPALMMLRTRADVSLQASSGAANQSQRQPQAASHPPPPPPPGADIAAVATAVDPQADNDQGNGGVVGGGPDGEQQAAEAEAGDQREEQQEQGPTKRSRPSMEAQRRGGGGSGEAPADSEAGSTAKAAAAAAAAALANGLVPWPQGAPHIFERRQAAAAATAAAAVTAATAAAGGIAMLANMYGSLAAAPSGVSSAQLEMSSVASDGLATLNNRLAAHDQGQGAGSGAHLALKRRRGPPEAGGEGEAEDAATAPAAAGDLQQIAMGRSEDTSATDPSHPSLPQSSQQQQQLRPPAAPLPPLPMAMGAIQPMLRASGGGAEAHPGDTLGLGLGLGLDPCSGLHLSHASALKLLQQHPHLGGSLPEGVAAMLLAAHHNHHHHNHSSANISGGGGPRQGGGGELSVGSPPGSTAAQTQPTRGGGGGGGGRPRHHHPHHHPHLSSSQMPAVPARVSGSTASGSTGTAFVRGGGGAAVGDESPSPQFQMPPPFPAAAAAAVAAAVAGGGAGGGMLAHMLPRAARNIEGLLPSRPLLHNPYVPSSGDPAADLTLSKIAQNGSREVEAELLGGTTGRAGHSGRCAVCVIQRKGKCGTESAPKKCLRRQLVALQRATGNGTGATIAALSGLSGGASGGGGGGGSGGGTLATDDVEEGGYVDAGVSGGVSGGGGGGGGGGITTAIVSTALYLDECLAAAAAEQRARERARRETWSLPLGQGSGATGKRPPQPPQPPLPHAQQQQFAAT